MSPLNRTRHAPARTQRGFTLLEVLVALVLLGIGVATAYTTISGSTRLDERMTGHAAAMVLAHSKLDEALASTDFELASEAKEDRYAGISFGYRVVLSPVELLDEAQKKVIANFPQQVQRVAIEVFWGPKDAPQTYTLTSYRIAPASGEAPGSSTRSPP